MATDRPLAEATVAELVTSLAASPADGGSTQVQEIIRRFEPLLRRAWLQGGFEVEYRDFLQEVMAELFAGLPALRQPRAFPGYFRRVALSVAARFARKARHQEAVEGFVPMSLANLGADLFARAAVRSVLERLPPRERAVVERLFLEEASVAEVASDLAIEPGTVRTTKSRALRRLREILEAEAELLENSKRKP